MNTPLEWPTGPRVLPVGALLAPLALVLALLLTAATAPVALAAGTAPVVPGPADPDAPRLKVYVTDMMGWGEVANLTLVPGDMVPLTLVLEDAQGVGLAGQRLRVESTAGNEVDVAEPVTGVEGRTDILYSVRDLGQDNLIIRGPRTTATLAVMVQESVDAQNHAFGAVPRDLGLRDIEGVLSWERLAEVEVTERDGLFQPDFAESVKALDGQAVKIQGFMLPLENSERQKYFVLSASPPSCFFCLPGGPESMVEVSSERGLAFTFEPILIEGTLEVLEDHALGLFYRMQDAEVSRVSP